MRTPTTPYCLDCTETEFFVAGPALIEQAMERTMTDLHSPRVAMLCRMLARANARNNTKEANRIFKILDSTNVPVEKARAKARLKTLARLAA